MNIQSKTKQTKILASAVLLVAVTAVLAGMIVNILAYSRALGEVEIQPTSGLSSMSLTTSNAGPCSSYNATTGILEMNVTGGVMAAACIAVAATTDGAAGYTLTIEGPATGNLVSSDNDIITSTHGIIGAPLAFATQSTGGAWGFAIPNSQISGLDLGFDLTYSSNVSSTARFAAVPNEPVPFSVTDAANTSANTYHVFFAVSAGPAIPIGVYTGSVTISATANTVPPPLILMQELSHYNCPTVRTMVVDARDNRSYWVQKMPDGMCWMQTNLAYAGGGNNYFGDVMPIGTTAGTITAATSAPGTLIPGVSAVSNQVCGGTNASMNTHGRGCFWEPVGSDPTTFPQTPSTSTTGAGQYGLLYNWCAAMGGQPAACQTAAATPADPTINICPAGWRLPAAANPGVTTVQENNTNEFWNLNQAINSGVANTSAGLLSNGLFQYSGWFSLGGFGLAGTNGLYWSSTVTNAAGSRIVGFRADNVAPASSASKSHGLSVRCVAEMPPVMQEITAANCPLERTLVRDARDNRTYWVRRIPNTRQGGGDLCWMETNLAYAGGGNNQFGDVMAITQGVVGTNTGAGEACFGDNSTMDGPCFWNHADANPTNSPQPPSTATDGGIDVAGRQFGYLYNWCAAMGNQPDACQATLAIQPDPSVSICPAGWRLPTGDIAVGEFALLHDAINGGSSTPAGLLTNGLFQFSGLFSNGSFSNQGAAGNGVFWTSRMSSGATANLFLITPVSVLLSVSADKGIGFSVRCVAD